MTKDRVRQLAEETWTQHWCTADPLNVVNAMEQFGIALLKEYASGEPSEARMDISLDEITRIRNTGSSDVWPKVWNRQLNTLCDAYREHARYRAMSAAALRELMGEG